MNRRIVVWLSVAPEKEQDFNDWYEQQYIPRFVTQIPGVKSVSRWKIEGTETYMTVYDLEPGADFDDVSQALGSSARDADRDEWKRWEQGYLEDFRDGFFSQTYEYSAEGVATP